MKRAVSISQKNGNSTCSHGQIQLAVSIEVAGHNGDWALVCRIADRRSKGTVSIAEQDGNRIGIIIVGRQIQFAIAVKVADRDSTRHIAGRIKTRGTKTTVAISHQYR